MKNPRTESAKHYSLSLDFALKKNPKNQKAFLKTKSGEER